MGATYKFGVCGFERRILPNVSKYGNRFSWVVGTPMHQKSSCKRSVGRPLPALAVRIVDPTDPSKPLDAGRVGRVLVKGAGLVSSCFASWADHLASCADQWVMTPFYGKLDEHGFLRLA